MRRTLAIAAALALGCGFGSAHRLDEYLQGTLISVEKNRMTAQITLTPGVAVLPVVLAAVDTDGNGVVTAAEQQAYVARVMRDLSFTVDGRPLKPEVVSVGFPSMEEMQDGRGEIRLEVAADLPRGGANRAITFENRHQTKIAAYQVNCLVPNDPDIRIVGQKRNYTQSVYRLEYEQAGVRLASLSFARWGDAGCLSAVAILLCARFAWLMWRRHSCLQSRHSCRDVSRASTELADSVHAQSASR